MERSSRSRLRQYLPISFMGLCTVGFLIFISINKDFTIADFLRITREKAVLTMIAVVVAFIIKSFVVFVPYAVIAVTAMVVLDFPEAITAVILGTLVNISIPYFTGRSAKDDWIQKIFGRFPKIRRFYEASDNLFLLSFTLRSMNLSNECLGVFFGSAGLSYFKYLLSSLIGIIPSATCYVLLGEELGNLKVLENPVFWGAIAVDAVMITCTTLYYRYKSKKKTQ